MSAEMSQIENLTGKSIEVYDTEDESARVLPTKHVFPEDYECKCPVKPKDKCQKPPKIDETIVRPITSNKLNTTIKNKNCSHCGEAMGECCCTSDEARKEMTRINEQKPEDEKPDADEISSIKK